MAKYKQSLPRWAQDVVLAYVRGYEDLVAWRDQARKNIIYWRQEAAVPGRPSWRGRPVEHKAERLLELEHKPNGRILAAIEQSLAAAGADIGDEGLRAGLRQALLLNCARGRDYPYECFDLPGISRKAFYRYRHGFLFGIAALEGLTIDTTA